MVICIGREWELELETNRSSLEPVEVWMRNHIHSMVLDMSDPNEADTVLISNPPSLKCRRYNKMTAYGNHWRIDNDTNRSMTNYDSGVACFEANEQSSGSGKDYVGILQDILVLDYGAVKTPVVLFSCLWKKRHDNHNRSTYVRDSDGFLVVNFKHNTPRSIDPFVFPSQCTQVFYSDDDLQPRGSQCKVVLRKEAKSRRKLEEDDDIFILTNVQSVGDVPSHTFRPPPTEPELLGAIVLNDADNALALQSFDKEVTRRPRRQQTVGNRRVRAKRRKDTASR